MGLLVVGTRLLLVRPFAAPKTKAFGAGLLVISLSALLELFPYTPAVRGLIHGSGMLGYLAAAGLIHTFNRVGAGIVAAAVFLSSLFLVTRFSFSWAAGFLRRAGSGWRGPWKRAGRRGRKPARQPLQSAGGARRSGHEGRQVAHRDAEGGDDPSPAHHHHPVRRAAAGGGAHWGRRSAHYLRPLGRSAGERPRSAPWFA